MTEHTIIERETVTDTSAAPRETVEKDIVAGVPHGDEEVGGAVLGGAAGAGTRPCHRCRRGTPSRG